MYKSIEFIITAIFGKNIGAVARSSEYVIKRVLDNLPEGQLKNIVEYGPGDGVLTVELLKRLASDGRLTAVEFSKSFADVLRKIDDPRLRVVEGKMQDVAARPGEYGLNGADLAVASIPFTLITKEERERVCKDTERALRPGGKFIIFHQYSTLMKAPLKRYFPKVRIFFEIRNIFPCFILCGEKPN